MLLAEWDLDVALEVREEEGIEKGVLKTACAMKEKGLDIGLIAEITKLPIDTILDL